MNTIPAPTVVVDRDGREYDHIQDAPLYWLLLVPAICVAIGAAATSKTGDAKVFLLLSVLLASLAFCFRWLRICDEGDYFSVRFGPIPLFGKRFRYADIRSAEPSQTSFVDSWGIHWVPGRGWTYNLWGFDCVLLTLTNGRTVRVGTDDPEGLASFLQLKIGSANY